MDVDTAVVLVGGPGKRLKPLTNDIPKAMVRICGKPFLEWIIEWLRDNKVGNVILGVSHLKEKIMQYFGDGSSFGVEIKYSTHTIQGGTGEGFRLAINRHVDDEVFFAMNGDQMTDLNLRNLAKFHLKHGSVATMAIFNPRCYYGHVQMNDEGDIVSFVEKQTCPYAYCNTGIYAFNQKILDYLPEKGDVERTTFPLLTKSKLLKAFLFNGFFVTVNTYKDLIEAEKELKRRHKWQTSW